MAIREVNDAGLDLIKSFEGIRDGDPSTPNLDPYMDPVSIWTIGWGHAIRYKGKFLKGAADRNLAYSLYKNGLSKQQCQSLLEADIVNFARDVSTLLMSQTTDNQFAALISFAYNVGVGNLKSSSLLRLHSSGHYEEASEEFRRWNRAGGKVLEGLTRRRRAEAELYRRA